MNNLIPHRAARRLKITETKYGRTIEAWVFSEEQPEQKEEQPSVFHQLWIGVSLFGWGVFGIAVGNLIFMNV